MWLALFLARATDPHEYGSFLMDEVFLHLDTVQRSNLLDVLRAIIARRCGEVNFILTTADAYFLSHAVQKLRPLQGLVEAPAKEPAVVLHTLTKGDDNEVKVTTHHC